MSAARPVRAASGVARGTCSLPTASNVRLRESDQERFCLPEQFRFSVLQILPKTMARREVLHAMRYIKTSSVPVPPALTRADSLRRTPLPSTVDAPQLQAIAILLVIVRQRPRSLWKRLRFAKHLLVSTFHQGWRALSLHGRDGVRPLELAREVAGARSGLFHRRSAARLVRARGSGCRSHPGPRQAGT